MTRKEHDVEVRWKLSEYLEAVKAERDAIQRRERGSPYFGDCRYGKVMQ